MNERLANGLRPLTFTPHYTKHAEGSCLVQMGNTWVVCTASIEDKVPPFLQNQKTGWVSAEYAMLPRSTHTRNQRESRSGKPSGRSLEISRLIGRALRASIDTKLLGERSILIDCDVLQADGSTRIASINGGFVALGLAVRQLIKQEKIKNNPIRSNVAGLSLGYKNGQLLMDLDYEMDANCDVDMNIVMLSNKDLVELQGTSEKKPFSVQKAHELLNVAAQNIDYVFEKQNDVLNHA